MIILSVIPNGHGSRAVVVNAAYGAASRIAQIVCSGDQVETLAQAAGTLGSNDALQVRFHVPQRSVELLDVDPDDSDGPKVAIERYGAPVICDKSADVRIEKDWALGTAGGQLVVQLREELRAPSITGS